MSIFGGLLEENVGAIAVLAVGLASGALWYYLRVTKKKYVIPTQWEEVGSVCNINIYCLKSGKPISMEAAEATTSGVMEDLLVDRSFMILTEEHKMVTGREATMLVTMETSVVDRNLIVKALDGEKISVNYDDVRNMNKDIIKFRIRGDPVQGVDCGDEAAAFFSKHLFEGRKKLRMVYIGGEEWYRPKRKLEYFEFPNFKKTDTAPRYYDWCTFLLANSASLDDLNSRITNKVTMGFFRPSIVVKGPPAFDEDTWEFVKVGENVIFHIAKPCERCILTTMNPSTGKSNKEHFEKLLSYRVPLEPQELKTTWSRTKQPVFGIHCGIDVPGRVHVGDKVYVSRFKRPIWKFKPL